MATWSKIRTSDVIVYNNYGCVFKGAWHENFEKLILLKLADKSQFTSIYFIHNAKTANLYHI